METAYFSLAQRIAGLFADRSEVEAVALSGSLGGEHTDAASDLDLYVYTHTDNFWGPGDEWFDAETGIEVDIVYFDSGWMGDQVRRVVLDHQASMGYSTCFWYTVHHSQVFYDPNGWFTGLQEICQRPYPELLRQNIIAHNHPVLREIIPSYFFQIEKAVKRGDLVSVNHRLAGLLASYFDIVFAINRELHPGEKHLVQKAVASCEKIPEDMQTELQEVLALSAVGDPELLMKVTRLLDHLDYLLIEEGFSL